VEPTEARLWAARRVFEEAERELEEARDEFLGCEDPGQLRPLGVRLVRAARRFAAAVEALVDARCGRSVN
jgi:hypothetical protein